MLKALELIGFKSFADRTRFEFPEGITVVVGPNGSGKSNVVDAIKWVLGEQSVKSLRGKEMADVIFNGSGARKGLNSAESTLTFDNTGSLLPIETPEVHVTRRVYRSGEGEYLINRQPCRLRDIRDLFAGTGVSTQAYSIIEQGKVDVMLQASPRDRRLIFEEAAGISRFKAKKIEALWRLDRVEQNLLRLSDIVDEVDNRLRVVRTQATKARRYKQYTDRLQELRTQVGLTDWRRLTTELERYERQLETLRAESAQFSAAAESTEVRSIELDEEIGQAEEALRQCERTMAENRERIATCESTIEHERARRTELQEETQRRQEQLAAMSTRTRDIGSMLQATLQEVAEAEMRHGKVNTQVAEFTELLTTLTQQFDRLRVDHQQRRSSHMDLVRRAGQLGNDIGSLETRHQNAESAHQQASGQLAELDETATTLADELAAMQEKHKESEQQLAACQHDWQTARQRLEELQRELAAAQKELAAVREAYTGAMERASVLDELEQRHEGLSSGVKQVLTAARQAAEGPFRKIRGLVADVLDVQVDIAPLIDVALGEKAGYLVVEPIAALGALFESQANPFSGRVGFVPLQAASAARRKNEVELDGRPGVVGRADRLVKTRRHCAEMTERLLGTTWIVEKLSHAMALAEVAPGQNFVTLAGQHLAEDGTLCVGPRHSTTGLISRRSELRALREKIDQLTDKIAQQEGTLERLDETVSDAHARVEALAERRESITQQHAEWRLQVTATGERQAELEEKRVALRHEADAAAATRDAAAADLEQLRQRRAELDSQVTELESKLEEDAARLEQIERQRQQQAGEATAAQVAMAKSEQQLASLAARMQQFQRDQQERQTAIDDCRQHLADAQQRSQQSERKILGAESEVAELYLRKDALQKQSVGLVESREGRREQRGKLVVDLQQIRAKIRKAEEDTHRQELAAGEVRHQRDTLAARMREDYDIELAELEHEPTEEEQHQREAVEEEIADLRRKLNNIGGVNLEALNELDDLETRYGDLSMQFDDLTSAKKTLEQIIDKINADSRRLFAETLETVRGHFQTLFRKLFGGGQADIIVEEEEGADILESGLEIVARPPGKEPRNISLLSGGEKTLTCVALLLAIFRSRPSPFCVLDEVDAALDEANIERFIGVLKEFLQWTQFIVITHSKKTMTCAGTLYGVTMQESGISKRVSVRFEDVSETGEILRTADEDHTGASEDDETQAA